ncbi:unnamed protein product [Echinostoma caproni]|uniref:Uncharacterized protein n=1 Tax=Echinostoma caproni TaxID=27848 RepID=A0A3P8CIK0_9TREM|nr:unnamed protein product [Echinostoma caproni]
MELGAIGAGGTDLFSRIEHGTFHWEEYDIVVAHTDWASTVSKLRHVLKDRLPTPKNGRIGEDISALVSMYVNGVGLESTRIEGVPEINNLDVIVGQCSNAFRPLICFALKWLGSQPYVITEQLATANILV